MKRSLTKLPVDETRWHLKYETRNDFVLFSVDIIIRPGVLDGAIYELVPPQVRETEVPTHGQGCPPGGNVIKLFSSSFKEAK